MLHSHSPLADCPGNSEATESCHSYNLGTTFHFSGAPGCDFIHSSLDVVSFKTEIEKDDEDFFNHNHPTIATVDVEAEESNITDTIGANMALLKRLFDRVRRNITLP